MASVRRLRPPLPCLAAVPLLLGLPLAADAQCVRTLVADVVAFDQVWSWNRLGAVQPQGMMFALRRDVVPISGTTLGAGNVRLRADKRPRPMVLRMNVGDCLRIEFQNLLDPVRRDQNQPATRQASVHAIGLQLVNSIDSDGSFVGQNASSLLDPGQSRVYTYYGEREGEHVLLSGGTTVGGEGDGGQINAGLFGAVIVEPVGARWYRSQVTRAEMDLVTTGANARGGVIINYERRYPVGHPRGTIPVLNMLDGNQIVHTDLTAVIAGSPPSEQVAGRTGWFPPGTFPLNQFTYPQREQPFREFVTIYHDEIGAVQAFPEFDQERFEHTLHSGRDAFAINYGAAGIGAEVLANRFRVGPMWNCTECKFEEFFLSSWAVGDPAMVVDVPANTRGSNGLLPGPKARRAFFPEDPSNVYHGYLGDHTRFRVLHAGSKEHHIHHLHAHQWLFSADSDKSTYLDSQAIGPGSSFTAEIAYHGAGNVNQTVGDSIFHCHFYPHFAQGMWALWRVHDVFERGTRLNDFGRPAFGQRALPDGEIADGTPIPGLIPLPGKPMAPEPGATVSIVGGQAQVTGTGNPGYPFFVPAKAGHRPPHPPLDTLHDGGLPRHNILSGTFVEAHTTTDFHKDLLTASAQQLPEAGTAIEQQAMAFHATRQHPSCEPSGVCDGGGNVVKFLANGHPPVAGAPFADPCQNAQGTTGPVHRRYKAADIEDDVKLNKKGWHFPQQRFLALWEDVDDFLAPNGPTKRPPEPLFIRANSGECIEFWLTNLVPNEYQLDDFQVRSPTDILGQHIHLVKFDVLASDGAGNGFNYEDGSFSPEEVVERINAIRAQNSCTAGDSRNGTMACPVAQPHPFFGVGPGGEWLGAQTTVQRWCADAVRDNNGVDRNMRTVFTHDHFGPSTHQQAGLYGGVVVEPAGSTWVHNETGTPFYTRHDGGPTSWQAVINAGADSYREFMLEFGDFQLAYSEEAETFPDRDEAINPPARDEVGLPDLLRKRPFCPNGDAPPCPELVSADDPGTMSVNYRNEPLALRVRNPATNGQAAGQAGDLAFAFSSSVTRADTVLNSQPTFYAPLTADVNPRDPFTPLLRAYENDRVQIRILVGGHEEGHNFSVHGIKWLFEPSEPRSGFRNSQMMGISEHFEFVVPQLIKNPSGSYVDRLWSAGSSTDDYWNGIWGLFRAYTGRRQDLVTLSTNPNGRSNLEPGAVGAFDFSCPREAPVRTFDVTAVAAQQALPGGKLFYNTRSDGSFGPLFDPTALLYVRSSDLNGAGQLLPGVPVEPLVLRARAGECIQLTLRNRLPDNLLELDGYNTLPMIVDDFNANDIKPSNLVGLHPQLLYYDVSRFDGANIGGNSVQTVAPGHFTTYQWYAGDVHINPDGSITATPIEFGATNLISADRLEHASKGAFGALIIEPADAVWTEGASRSVAEVSSPGATVLQDGVFREQVLQFQNDVNMRTGEGLGEAVKNLAELEDPEDTGQKAINYRTEPLWKRMQHAPETPLPQTDDFNDWYDVVSNGKVGGDPQTPVFTVSRSWEDGIRFRLLMSGGHSRNIVFALHGHTWDKQPYIAGSTRIGRNDFSFWEGARMGHGPSNHFDAVIRNGPGGKFSILGDYLFRDQVGTGFDGGMWGILRVVP